jgi:hypothetical protein
MNLTIEHMIRVFQWLQLLAQQAPGAYELIMAGRADELDWAALEGRSKEELRREVDQQFDRPTEV